MKDYIYPTNPGNPAGVTSQNPGGWTKTPLGFYVSGFDSSGSNEISQGYSASLTTCMTTCQQTPNCIYVTYANSTSNCKLNQNFLSQASTITSPSLIIGVIVQNPLITNKYY